MRFIIVVLVVVGIVGVLWLRTLARPEARRSRRDAQPVSKPIASDELPTPGSADLSPHRPDGNPVPGSPEDRRNKRHDPADEDPRH